MGAVPNQNDYMAFDSGRMTRSQEIDFFQRLLDTGEIDTLGARYQKRVAELLAAGEVYVDA